MVTIRADTLSLMRKFRRARCRKVIGDGSERKPPEVKWFQRTADQSSHTLLHLWDQGRGQSGAAG